MSVEAVWYRMHDHGQPPHCRRLSRLPMPDQWTATITLAGAFAAGRAGYRRVSIQRTREIYWYWPASPLAQPHDTGWWLIPHRITQRVFRLHDAALRCAMRTPSMRHPQGGIPQSAVIAVLHRWQRTNTWRHHITDIFPRTPARPV